MGGSILPPMVVFIGLDLAWTAHHETGVCVFESSAGGLTVPVLETRLASPSAFAAFIAGYGQDIVVAIDAPLIVGPGRTAERAVGRAFGRYKASAHSANAALLATTGRTAGPDLAAALAADGFRLDPRGMPAHAPGRWAIEVYPHAQHVVLFKLEERLKYKAKRGRNVAFLREELKCYQFHLAGALNHHLPGVAAHPCVATLLAAHSAEVRGRARKAFEDRLDALTCAFAAWLAWERGLTAGEVLGDECGYVAVPGMRFDARFGAVTSAPAPTSPSG